MPTLKPRPKRKTPFRRHRGSLADLRPQIAKEWHPTKNGSLTPKDVTPGSGRKVWWRCHSKFKHEWLTTVGSRLRGSNCPYCGNRFVSPETSLAAKFPEIAKEWHPTKNGKHLPEHFLPGSSKYKPWWLCSKNPTHEWQAVLGSRTSGGRGCPLCHSQTSKPELRLYSELKSIFEDSKHRYKIDGDECDVYIPSIKLGIELDGERWHRPFSKRDFEKNRRLKSKGIVLIRLRGKSLPKISRLDINFNDSALLKKITVNQLLLHICQSRKISANVTKKIKDYIRSEIFVSDELYRNLQDMLPGPLPGRSLHDVSPKTAELWHPTKNLPLTAKTVTAGSPNFAWWQCKKVKKHVWHAIISAVKNSPSTGCPYCQGSKVSPENSLYVVNRKVANTWHPTKNGSLTSKDVTPNSSKKVWWLCTGNIQHEFQAIVSNRNKNRDCPYCSGKLVALENSVLTKRKDLVRIWHPSRNKGLTPDKISLGSEKRVWWVCSKNGRHVWENTLANQVRNKPSKQCPYCSKRLASSEYNFKKHRPDLAEYWHPTKNGTLSASSLTPYSHEEVWWQCRINPKHEWTDSIESRVKAERATCPFCVGQKLCEENTLSVKVPALAAEWHPTKNGDATPQSTLAKSGKNVWWRCSKDGRHEWQATPANRSNGTKCPFCSGKRVDSSNSLLNQFKLLAMEWHPEKNAPLTPRMVTRGSNKKVWWKCRKNSLHVWMTSPNNRTRNVRPSGCPYCAGRVK